MKRSPLKRTGRWRRAPNRRLGFVGCAWPGCRLPLRIGTYCRPHAVQACDRVVRAHVLERDRVCLRCGAAAPLVWAHILSRRSHVIRWSLDNAIALCEADEAWFTEHPAAWRDFIEARFPGRLQALRDERARGARPDMGAILERFGKAAA